MVNDREVNWDVAFHQTSCNLQGGCSTLDLDDPDGPDGDCGFCEAYVRAATAYFTPPAPAALGQQKCYFL